MVREGIVVRRDFPALGPVSGLGFLRVSLRGRRSWSALTFVRMAGQVQPHRCLVGVAGLVLRHLALRRVMLGVPALRRRMLRVLIMPRLGERGSVRGVVVRRGNPLGGRSVGLRR